MVNNQRLFWKKFLLAIVPIGFAIFVLLYPGLPERKLDNSVLLLVAIAILIIVLPWERLDSFKAAGVEFTLDKLQIDKAIDDLEILKGKEYINDENLWNLLNRMEPEIRRAMGSRILWIDDNPYSILGERRLFRALKIETVMVTSSDEADRALDSDGDFDLIISDMRSGEDFIQGKTAIPEAVRFIKSLRQVETKRQLSARYSHIPFLLIIIYSGKDYEELLNLTNSIRDSKGAIIIVNGVDRLFEEVLRSLSFVRAEPIKIVLGSEVEDNKQN